MTEAEAVAPGGSAAASEAVDDAADALRGRVDLFGKTLAAIATLGTGAVGLSTVADLAPLRDEADWYLALAAMGALLLAALAAVDVATRLMRVGEPVIVDVETTAQIGVEENDGRDVERIFSQAAKRFGFVSLAGVQERERSLRAAAARTTAVDERSRRTELADELRSEIDLAASHARLAIVRRRSTEAVSGTRSRFAYGVVAAGLLVFALLSDVLTSDDSEAVEMAQACAEARKAGATEKELKSTSCDASTTGEDEDEDPEPPTAEQIRVDLAAQLTVVLADCVARSAAAGEESEERPIVDNECDALRAAIRDLMTP